MKTAYLFIPALLMMGLTATPAPAASNQQPYAGQQARTIKAMSADEVQGHLDGKGLGYAKAAELNHYPGPLHLRQLDGKLSITADQSKAINAIERDMNSRARDLGKQIIGEEQALDALFADATATPDAVRAATVEIGRLKGELRAAHLNAHVRVRPLLKPHQIATYDDLRGYGKGSGSMDHGGNHGSMKH